MNRIEKLTEKYLAKTMLICLFLGLFLVYTKTRLYGDDWAYYQFTSAGIPYYLHKTAEHYFKAGGRAIVHILATLLIRFDLHLWWILASGMMVYAVKMSKDLILIKGKTDKKQEIVILLSLLLYVCAMDQSMTEQSTFWFMGFFNYFYPLFILIAFMKRMLEAGMERIRWYDHFLGFLAAASVEQAGMMSLGVMVLLLMDYGWMQKQKIPRKAIFLLLVLVIGLATVLLAPAQFYRLSIGNQMYESKWELVVQNYNKIVTSLYYSRFLLLPTVFLMVATLTYTMNKIVNKKCKWILASMIILWGFMYGTAYLSKMPYFNLGFLETENVYKTMWLSTIMGLSMGNTGFVALHAYLYRSVQAWRIPILSFILGYGSLLMMLVSPTLGLRNFIFVYFMLAIGTLALFDNQFKGAYLYIVTVLFALLTFNKTFLLLSLIVIVIGIILYLRKKPSYIGTLSVIVLSAFLCGSMLLTAYRGYGLNASYYDKNLVLAQDYIQKADIEASLLQYKMPQQSFHWAMPYENSYYNVYYNLYLGVPWNTVVEWR